MVNTSEVHVKGILSWYHRSGPWTYCLKVNFFTYAGNKLLLHSAVIILYPLFAPCNTLSFCSDFCGFVCISIRFLLRETESSRDTHCSVTVQKIIIQFWSEKNRTLCRRERIHLSGCIPLVFATLSNMGENVQNVCNWQ